MLRRKKRNSIDFRRFIQPLTIGFVVLGLIVFGIFIGLTINSRRANSPQRDLAKEQNGVTDQQAIYPTKTIPISSSLTNPANDKNANNGISQEDQITNDDQSLTNKEKTETKKTKAAKQKITDSLRAQKPIVPAIDSSVIAKHDAQQKTE